MPSSRPLDLPEADAYPHGIRARYVTGCRCDDCRRANRLYAAGRARAQRRGDWNGLVSADRARAHLLTLRAAGVGRRSIAEASGVSQSSIAEVIAGRKIRISARTEKALLDVDVDAGLNDAKLVASADLLALLEAARVERGWTKRELAHRFGYKTNALQFNAERMTARNVARVQRFLRALGRSPTAPSPTPAPTALRKVKQVLAGTDPWKGRAVLAEIAEGYGLSAEGDPWTLAMLIRRHLASCAGSR